MVEVKVTVTTLDGEVLDSVIVFSTQDSKEVKLTQLIVDVIESNFETRED